jgi:hypothetical protein
MIPGPNRIEEKLTNIVRLPTSYGQLPEKQLAGVFARFFYPRMNDRELTFSLTPPLGGGMLPGSAHIARLAFAGEIARKLNDGSVDATSDAEIETARKLRLVTPLTGAVVLENKEQYAEHDLSPTADVDNVPTIPEPEELALMAVVCILLLLLYCRRRRARMA